MLVELFWSKVTILGLEECWPWTDALGSTGYGHFSSGYRKGKSQGAHRVAYELTHGSIPSNHHVLHSCDNRVCCNPTHLFSGTPRNNMDDKVNKGRQAKGLGSGRIPKVSPEQVSQIKWDGRPQWKIALEYGVSQGQVSRIKSSKPLYSRTQNVS